MNIRVRARLLAAVALVTVCGAALHAAEPIDVKFSFSPKPVAGHVQVRAEDTYNVNRGYGFDLGSKVTFVTRGGDDAAKAGFVTGAAARPFFFSTKLDPGAYRVRVTLGDANAESTTTVKSETRRLMLEAVHTRAGEFVTREFLVHVRVPRFNGGDMVRLKAREKEPILYVQWDPNDASTRLPFVELDWDEKLTLEFSDAAPAVAAIEIGNVEKPTTVFLIGDSTMTDQMMEPWAAWGQMFPRWFKPPIVIANYAESGETTASFIGEKRWPKLLTELHAGDTVLMQFGINDQRLPLEQFKNYFVQFIKDTRERGANPVLVTSQNLRARFFDANGKGQQTLGRFPDAMREVARAENVPLIDLNAMSLTLYEAIGQEELPKAFVDTTHHTDWGAYELAKCVVGGAIAAKLPFVDGNLAEDWRSFDPAHPDPLAGFHLPPDPQLDPARPGGPAAPDGRGGMAGDAPRGRGAPPAGDAPRAPTAVKQSPAPTSK